MRSRTNHRVRSISNLRPCTAQKFPRPFDLRQFSQHRGVALFTIQSDFRYDVVRKIFEGGMGIVASRATRHATSSSASRSRSFAPITPARKPSSKNFIGRPSWRTLIHTNIVQTYRLGRNQRVCFIAMGSRREPRFSSPSNLAEKRKQLPLELGVFITNPRRPRPRLRPCQDRRRRQSRFGVVHRDELREIIKVLSDKTTDFGIAARGFLTDQFRVKSREKPTT